MRRLIRENSLGIVTLGLFLVVLCGGQILSGHRTYNDDQSDHGQPTVGLVQYLGTAHFGEATFENWESEFLQMGAYVLLTVRLRQRGSAESKGFEEPDPVDEDPARHRSDPEAPWPVRRGGLALTFYKRSLSIALVALFLASWLGHAITGAREFSADRAVHGLGPVSATGYMTTSRFWFESMQNWQSEFLAVAAIVILSIFLRQQGSPESKPVHAPHHSTGTG